MPAPRDLVHESSTSTGTGNLTVAAVNGKVRFSDATYGFGTGGTDAFDYYIIHRTAAEWERGTGHMSDANTLVRDTVIASSNANAAVNFSAGLKDVVNDVPAGAQARIPAANSTNDRFWGWVGSVGAWTQLTIGMIPDTLITFAKMATAAIATAAEMRAATASKLLSTASVYGAQAPVALTETGGAVPLDLATFTNATVTIDENSTFGNPSNEASVIGKSGWIKVTASGGTRTMQRHADLKSVGITWPISIASGQSAYFYYEVEAADVIQILAVRNNPA